MVPVGPKATNFDHNFEAINDTGVSYVFPMTLCFTVLALGHFATTKQLESFGKGDNIHAFLLQPDWSEEDAPHLDDNWRVGQIQGRDKITHRDLFTQDTGLSPHSHVSSTQSLGPHLRQNSLVNAWNESVMLIFVFKSKLQELWSVKACVDQNV